MYIQIHGGYFLGFRWKFLHRFCVCYNHFVKKFLKENVLFFALFISIIATVGSLYFSEFAHFLPCILCWYQRICMYPLVAILCISIIRNNTDVAWYVFPFSIIGMLIGIFHNLLYYHIIPEAAAPCRAGVSCTTHYIAWFGFVTIPLLSLLAFIIITVCMIVYLRLHKE